MKRESDKFWEGSRSLKLSQINMNRHEVITLASIVEKETNKNDEKAKSKKHYRVPNDLQDILFAITQGTPLV